MSRPHGRRVYGFDAAIQAAGRGRGGIMCIEAILKCVGLPKASEHPVIDSPEELRALDNRLLKAKERELQRWNEVKRASLKAAMRHVLD